MTAGTGTSARNKATEAKAGISGAQSLWPCGGGLGLSCALYRDAGKLREGALCTGTTVVGHMGIIGSRKPYPFVSTSQGVSPWRPGVAGSPLARTALVGVRAPDSRSLAWASGQRGHCWGGGRAALARPLLTKLPAVVEPGRQALAPSPVSFLPQGQHEWG